MRDNRICFDIFYPGMKCWDAEKVRENFSMDDANSILETSVPQRTVEDRIAWSRSVDGVNNVKTGYRMWHNQNIGSYICTQSEGWNRI